MKTISTKNKKAAVKAAFLSVHPDLVKLVDKTKVKLVLAWR